MRHPLRRRATIACLCLFGLVGLLGAAFLFAPNEIAEAPPGTCVSRYMGERYRIVDSCDGPFAHYAVIASVPVRESMRDSSDWEQRYCDERVDGWATYTIVDVEGADHIVCLGRANH